MLATELRRPLDEACDDTNHHAACSAEPFAKPDHRAKRHGKPKKPSYFNKPRRDEVIGGGFFVFRRGDAGRVRPGGLPYEHGTLEGAQAEAERLAGLSGGSYEVFGAALAADEPDTFAVCVALDAFWTEAFPDGPDGPLDYGFGHLSDDTAELWRKCRAAIAKAMSREGAPSQAQANEANPTLAAAAPELLDMIEKCAALLETFAETSAPGSVEWAMAGVMAEEARAAALAAAEPSHD